MQGGQHPSYHVRRHQRASRVVDEHPGDRVAQRGKSLADRPLAGAPALDDHERSVAALEHNSVKALGRGGDDDLVHERREGVDAALKQAAAG